MIVQHLPDLPEVEKAKVAPPGFINFTLKDSWIASQTQVILDEGEAYGNTESGKGSKVQLEFVSVNPTGPIHVGHGRGAVLGSALASMLTAAGYEVEKEYYINDAGGQIDVFRASLYVRYMQALGHETELPEDAYHGDYMIDLAKEIIEEKGDIFASLPREEAISQLGEIGYHKMMDCISGDLEKLGVCFDVWFSEKSLYDGPQYDRTMSLLREGGHIAEKEGAIWFAST